MFVNGGIFMTKNKEKDNELVKKVEQYANLEKAEVIPLCIKIEEELASLDGDDKKEMLDALRIK